MGWDAYATLNGNDLELSQMGDEPGSGLILTDADLRLAFSKAAQAVSSRVGNVDGMLRLGGLNCGECGRAIDRWGGVDPWGAKPYSLTPEQVRIIVRDWKQPFRHGWTVLSAYCFLQACADHGLGVRFSW